jgi:hypothetical protein
MKRRTPPLLPGQRHQSKPQPADTRLPYWRPDARCNSRIQNVEEYCDRPSGFQTNHPGIGRCWAHGGNTPKTADRKPKR